MQPKPKIFYRRQVMPPNPVAGRPIIMDGKVVMGKGFFKKLWRTVKKASDIIPAVIRTGHDIVDKIPLGAIPVVGNTLKAVYDKIDQPLRQVGLGKRRRVKKGGSCCKRGGAVKRYSLA